MGVKVRERPKGSGVYWLFITHEGKRKAKRVGTKRAAETAAKKVEAQLALGLFNLEEKKQLPSFEEYADNWLETYVRPLRQPATYERYTEILGRHVYPVFASRPIDQIRRKDVKNLLLHVNKKGYSRSVVCLVRDVVSGALGYAVDDELILANPVTGVLKRLKLERDKRISVEPFNQEEVDLFLKTCAEKFSEYYTFYLCAFRTGMRLGELLALQWGDVDWNRKFIRVERSYKRGLVGKTKNGRSRNVDMSDQLVRALKDLLTHRKREALKIGKGDIVEIVFHKDGRHRAQNSVRNVYKRILKKAGIRNMRFHDIRHTFASLLLSNGESPVYVKEQLGHSSIQMTVDIYGHLIPSSNRQAVNRLDGVQPSATYLQPEKTNARNSLELQAF